MKDQPEIELTAGSFSRLEEPDVQAKFSEGESAKAKHEAVAEAPAAQHEAAAEEAPSRPSSGFAHARLDGHADAGARGESCCEFWRHFGKSLDDESFCARSRA